MGRSLATRFPASGEAEGARSVRRNAGWLTLATVSVGATNFAYVLLLTWLLSNREYAEYAGIQALLLICGTASAASIPWVLTHRVPGAGGVELDRVVSFAIAVTAIQGLIAAVIVGGIASGMTRSVFWIAGSAAMFIFMAAAVVGFLQGHQRFRTVALLRVVEVAVKVASALLLIRIGLGVAGAVAGFLVGSLAIVVLGGPPLLRRFRARVGFVLDRVLWREALGLASIQAAVAVLASLDLVIGTLFSRDTSSLTGYQVATVLSRVPFFLSVAISTAAFARMAGAGRGRQPQTMRTAVDVMGSSGLPVAFALATLPLAIAQVFLPGAYADRAIEYLPYTAAIALLASFTNVVTTFFQAEARFARCTSLLVAAIVIDASLIAAGLAAGGITGLAFGSLAGQILALALVSAAAWRVWGRAILPRPRLALVAVLVFPMLALQAHPIAWFAFSLLVCGVAASIAFLDIDVMISRLFGRYARVQGRSAIPVRGQRPTVYMLTSQPVSPPWNGGDKNLAKTLLSGDSGVDFAFVGQPTDTSRWPSRHHRKLLADQSVLPSGRTKLRLFWSALVHWPRMDLVHAIITFRPGLVAGLALLSLRHLTGVPLVVTCPSGRNLPLSLLRRASAVVVISRATSATLGRAGVDSVRLIPPAVDLNLYRPGSAENARRRLGLPRRPMILFAGHYDAGGGFEEALRLLQEIRGRLRNTRMLVAMRRRPGYADARRADAAQVLIDKLDLRGCVIQLDGQVELSLLLHACDVAVFQPRTLGMKMDIPLTLVEALASGRPIVVSHIESLGELADGSNAVCVDDPGGTRSISYVERILTDPAFAAEARTAARALAEQRYGADVMSEAYRELYSELVLGHAVAEDAEQQTVAESA
jgi:O-antigen/teichoic acid export membrane protein/glycosyltransferase involved in cell wall biosynthesis